MRLKDIKRMLIVPVSASIAFLTTAIIANAMYHKVVNSFSYLPPRVVSRVDYTPVRLCYPTIKPEPSHLKSVKEGDATYWEVHFQDFQNQTMLFFITSKDKDGTPTCAWLNRFKDGQRLDFLPETVAVEFSSIHYQEILTRCESRLQQDSKDKTKTCKALLNQELARKSPRLFQEDVLALAKLQIGNFHATVPRTHRPKLPAILPARE
jgi:hypothetical protein